MGKKGSARGGESSTGRDIPSLQERRRLLTVYGRKAVQEALDDPSLDCQTLHLADSNRVSDILHRIEASADARGLETRYHSREALARISRNGRQDQGVALDIRLPAMRDLSDYLSEDNPEPQVIIGLDGITNPQNFGMVIRSAAAAGVDAVLVADRGNPALGPLVIKASAGTVFRAPLLRCKTLTQAVSDLLDRGFQLYRLQAGGRRSLFDATPFTGRSLFVLGGETDGISPEIAALPGEDLHIPMANGVESLNVAVSASLVVYAATKK